MKYFTDYVLYSSLYRILELNTKEKLMLKFDTNNKTFEPLTQGNFKQEHVLERYDFQSAIVNSWDKIKNNLNIPTAYLVGQEVTPHHSVQNSIDLLAFDTDDSSIIVIELKRDKDKLQLLQSLTYASMVATWDKETLIDKIQHNLSTDTEELIDLINDNPLSSTVKIILISERYDPEVIITADWLSNEYGMNVTAFSVSLYKLEGDTFVNFEQRLPLKELDDVYEKRGASKSRKTNQSTITWDDVLPKLKYPFAKEALDYCLLTKEGDPSRRRFVSFRSNHDGFAYIIINFTTKYINVYIKGQPENAELRLKQHFKNEIEVSEWAQGYSFKVANYEQFQELKSWLG